MIIIKEETESFIISDRDYVLGELILDLYMDNETVHYKDRDKYTIEVREEEHLMHPTGKFINHSCDPNMFFNKQQGAFFARRDIPKGSPMTFNYLENESSIASPFDCGCEEAACVGRVE